MKMVSGSKVIATAGTPERLVAVSTLARWVDIQADYSNTDNVFIGGAEVDGSLTPAVGLEFPPGAVYNVGGLQQREGPVDLNKIWVDVLVNGEGVNFNYWEIG